MNGRPFVRDDRRVGVRVDAPEVGLDQQLGHDGGLVRRRTQPLEEGGEKAAQPVSPHPAGRGGSDPGAQLTGAGGGTRSSWKKSTSLSSGGRPTWVTVSTSLASA